MNHVNYLKNEKANLNKYFGQRRNILKILLVFSWYLIFYDLSVSKLKIIWLFLAETFSALPLFPAVYSKL